MSPPSVLARDLPFPIARLARQSRNAKSYSEAHNRAWFAWECSIRLAAIGAAPETAGGLRHGSVGDWARLVPAAGRNLDAAAIVLLHEHLVRVLDPDAGRRTSVGRRELLDALVAYRNRVIGHGPSRDEEFCRAGAQRLRDALAAAWEADLFLPADARMVFVETIELLSNGQRAARVLDLGLETPTVLEREQSLVPDDVAAHRVHLRRGAAWTALAPWLVFDPADASFFVFQALKRRPDFVDYSSGRGLSRDDLERLAPGAELEIERRLRAAPTAAEPERATTPGARPFAGYEVLGEIGRGGMGVVYLANQVELSRLVALKTLPAESRADPVLRARFHREIEALARCDHPNVVKIHASGEEGGVPYFAMEYVAGADLRRVGAGLARTKSMERALELAWEDAQAERGPIADVLPRSSPPVLHGLALRDRYRAAASLVRDAALGVQALHDCGIVHRDLSPANILVTSGETRAVVMDLGLALLEDGHKSLSRDAGRILGTLRYMPPEQLQRNLVQVDRRADVYALGAVLYELLGDTPFFDGDTEARLIEQVLRETPVPVRRIDRAIPEDLARIVAVATDKDPRLRYPTAAAFAADLEAFLEGRPVSARVPTPAYVVRRWIGRNPALAAAIAAGILGVGTTTWLYLAAATNERLMRARALALTHERRIRSLDDFWRGVPATEVGVATLKGIRRYFESVKPLIDEYMASLDAAEAEKSRWSQPAHGLEAFDLDLALSQDESRARLEMLAAWRRYVDSDAGLLKRIDLDEARMRALLDDVPEQGSAWTECAASIAARPRYAGLRVDPQRGLRPLRVDPASGLWEFWHMPSGARPTPGSKPRAEDGLVLVLIPGGTATIGAQASDPGAPFHDTLAGPECAPVRTVRLDPYFISKHEMTQAQWMRVHLANPSHAQKPRVRDDDVLRPVENVSWLDATRTLAKLGLVLPTEAQWEHACRAGTTTVWSSGDAPESQREVANLADDELKRRGGPPGWNFELWNDGHRDACAVGSLAPNPFGLHDVHGNVMEWTAETAFLEYELDPREGDGLRTGPNRVHREFGNYKHAARGGGWQTAASRSRSSHRYGVVEDVSFAIGVRPARALDPPGRVP